MGKQWARQEVKKDVVADRLTQAASWVTVNREKALAIGGIAVGAILLGVYATSRIFKNRETAWEHLVIAQSYAYQGQLDKALEQFRVLEDQFAQTPASGFAMLSAGDILFRQGHYKEAAQAYQKLLNAQTPKSAMPYALSDLGISQESAGDCKNAVDTAQRFLDAYPDHFLAPQAHASLARCQESMGLKDKAKATYERMALLYPDSFWAQWAQARLKS